MKLLIADDDPVSRRLLEKHALSWGFQVILAQDGKAALDVLSRGTVQLALVDWMMPGITGVEICRRVRRASSEEYRYIILFTSKNRTEDIVAGLEAGADDYVIKPFNALELEARLKTGRRVILLQNQLLAYQEKLHRMAVRDDLTGLHNRREILRILEREAARTRRKRSELGLILLDIDHFKAINDRHGHPVGDAVLTELAERLGNSVRAYDEVGRYGGEEFLVVLPDCDAATTRRVAERLRQGACATPMSIDGVPLRTTISLGCAHATEKTLPSLDVFIKSADQALYDAKRGGRNRVVMSGPPAKRTSLEKEVDHETSTADEPGAVQ